LLLDAPMTEQTPSAVAPEAELAELRRDVARYQAELRVQQRIWEMRDPDDIADVWQTIVDSLGELGIPFDHCGINVVDSDRGGTFHRRRHRHRRAILALR
jgi:hypothetical protein